MWRGSKINYSNIKLDRHFYPPPRGVVYNNIIGEYDYYTNKTTLYISNFKKVHGNKESRKLRNELIRILNHELTHGVIMSILKADRFSGKVTLEYPLYNGFDKTYTYVHKKHSKCGKRLFG